MGFSTRRAYLSSIRYKMAFTTVVKVTLTTYRSHVVSITYLHPGYQARFLLSVINHC